MDAGMMRHYVQLQRETKTLNDAHQRVLSWEPFANDWCSIIEATSVEKLEAAQMEAEITHKVFMRYRSDLKSTDRISHVDGNITYTYQLKGAPSDPDGRRKYMRLNVVEDREDTE